MRREDERYYRSKLLLLDSDLEEFDRRLRARFPDLCIFEDNQELVGQAAMKLIDSATPQII